MNRSTYDPEIADRALRVIEGLTFEDIAMDPMKKLEEIYTYAHIGVGRCKNPHLDWREQLVEAEQALIEMGIMGPEKVPCSSPKDK